MSKISLSIATLLCISLNHADARVEIGSQNSRPSCSYSPQRSDACALPLPLSRKIYIEKREPKKIKKSSKNSLFNKEIKK